MRPSTPPLLATVLGLVLSGPSGAEERFRLPRDVVPTPQFVRLELDPSLPDYSGTARIALRVETETDSLRFHAEEIRLESVELHPGEGAEPLALTTTPGALGLVTAVAPRALAPGDYTLEIRFANDYDTRAIGLYRLETGGEGYLFTQFEAIDARKAFPCWDEPSFKLPYQLELVVPAGLEAVTNTPVARETAAGERKAILFEPTPPLPSYLVAIAVGPLEATPIPGLSIPGRILTVRGNAAYTALAAEQTPPILAALERYFEQPYPFAKLDLIAVPEYWPGAMENPGLVTYAEPILLHDPRSVTFSDRRRLAYVTAHELAHMWFGDLVTMDWWDDLWLNEAFADWMGSKIADQVFPELGVPSMRIRSLQAAMETDALPSSRTIRQPVTDPSNLLQSADELTYYKGETLVGMVEQWVGPEVFRGAVIEYLNAHAWGNATAADLWSALSRASGADVGAVMSSFLDQPGVPLVTMEAAGGRTIRLTQERLLHAGAEGSDEPLWRIPIVLRYPDGDAIRTRKVLLTRKTATVPLDGEGSEAAAPGGGPPAWIHPNAAEAGYYRWRAAPALLAPLTRGASEFLSPRERIGLIGHLAALLEAGALPVGDLLAAFSNLAADPDPEVLTGLLAELDEVREALVTEDLRDDFALYVRRTFGPVLARLGWQKRPGEPEATSLARRDLLEWLGDHGRDQAVRAYADSLARAELAARHSVDPSLAGVALRLAAIDGDEALFEACRRAFENAPAPGDRPTYLAALGNFRRPDLVDRALAYALEGPLRPQEIFAIPIWIGHHEPLRDRQFVWMMDHYDELVARVPPEIAAFMPRSAGGCSIERIARARAFFAAPGHAPPGTGAQLVKVSERVERCLALREREREAARAYLEGFRAGD